MTQPGDVLRVRPFSAGPALSFDDEEMTCGVTELEPGALAFVIVSRPRGRTLCIVCGRLRWTIDGLLTSWCVPMYVCSKTGKTTYVRPDGFRE